MKKLLLALAIFILSISLVHAASMGQVKVVTILDEVSTTGAGDVFKPLGTMRTFQSVGAVTTGTGGASISIEASNDETNWVTLDTLSLNLTATKTSDYYEMDAAWRDIRGNVINISGTNATISLDMGVQL